MKRLTMIILCVLLLCACGGDEPEAGVTPAPNIFDCVVNIGGDEFKLPMPIIDAVAMGWSVTDSKTNMDVVDVIVPGQHAAHNFYIEKDGSRCMVESINFSDDPQPLVDCHMTFLAFGNEEGVDFALPGGLESGKATRDDIIAVYGETNNRGYPNLLYTDGAYNEVFLYFDADGLLAGGSFRYHGWR